MGTKTWTDEQLAEAIASSTTWPQVATKLGISPGGGRYLKTWANRLGLDYSHYSHHAGTAKALPPARPDVAHPEPISTRCRWLRTQGLQAHLHPAR